jgi:hypothetical protein
MLGDAVDVMCEDQSAAAHRFVIVFLGVTAMDHQDSPIEPRQKVPTVGFDLKLIHHPPTAIGDHPVDRHDRIAFDAELPEHGWSTRLTATQRPSPAEGNDLFALPVANKAPDHARKLNPRQLALRAS